jgi:hypothetical protein
VSGDRNGPKSVVRSSCGASFAPEPVAFDGRKVHRDAENKKADPEVGY